MEKILGFVFESGSFKLLARSLSATSQKRKNELLYFDKPSTPKQTIALIGCRDTKAQSTGVYVWVRSADGDRALH
jgi:hypothetical protein